MPRKITMVLTGSEELNRKLEELTSKQAKEAIRKAARPALQPTLAAARANAPKRSGRLQRSIKIRAIKRSRSRVGARVTTAKSDNQFSGRTFYAAFQEWGWKTGSRRGELNAVSRRIANQLRRESRAAKGLKKRGSDFRARQENYFASEGARRAARQKIAIRRQIPAKEFLRRAARSTKSQALKLYSDSIRSYIRSIART
ncbi:HK97-gp10 family putative phage morphogenesis protein [Pirellulaceae bacterium SH501]